MIKLQPHPTPTPGYTSYALEGLDDQQFMISKVDGYDSWYIVSPDDRELWFRLGDREDLIPEWMGDIPTFWNGDFEFSTERHSTHEEWLEAILEAKNKSEAR